MQKAIFFQKVCCTQYFFRYRAILCRWFILILVFSFFIAQGCSSIQIAQGADQFLGREMWTASNLRVLDKKYIYWQNYGHGLILPLGTCVRFISITTKTAEFIDNNNHHYIFYWPHQAGDLFKKYVFRYFSFQNPLPGLEAFDDDTVKAIGLGSIVPGMTTKAVFLSRGYPAKKIKSATLDIWVYRQDYHQNCLVYFDDGVVVQVR